MDFQAIIIHYWDTSLQEIIKLQHKGIYKYSEEFILLVTNKCLENNLQVMLTSNPEMIVTIHIDNRRFRQR